jgi:hypothetical protein
VVVVVVIVNGDVAEGRAPLSLSLSLSLCHTHSYQDLARKKRGNRVVSVEAGSFGSIILDLFYWSKFG